MNKLAQVLDAEFERVSKSEDVPMLDLVEEISSLTGYSQAQLYNFRKGRFSVPSSLLPILCKRFKSRALIEALDGEIGPDPAETADFNQLAIEATREACELHYSMIGAFKAGGVTRKDLIAFEESIERIGQMQRKLLRMLGTESESRDLPAKVG
ncbi:MAG TPA: hypothetical protein VJX67_21015 [Blastocatellia bacterium]|nr:hypothetical protein [Blastocatellia bacterium]